LTRALERNVQSHGPDDFVSKQLREQLASIQEAQPSTYLQFTLGGRSPEAEQPSSPSNGEPA
jgi:hypothetical protein